MELNLDGIAPKISNLHVFFCMLYYIYNIYLQMYLEGDRYHVDMFACFQCKNAGCPLDDLTKNPFLQTNPSILRWTEDRKEMSNEKNN